MNFRKFSAITQSQTILIMGIVGLVLFAFIGVPFYKSCKQKAVISKLKIINTLLLQANSNYLNKTSDNPNDFNIELSAQEFAETYYKPYIQYSFICEGSQKKCWKSPQYTDLKNNKYLNNIKYSIALKNGTVIGFSKNKNNLISMIVDINGTSGENKLSYDVFVFSFYNSQNPPKLCEESEYSNMYIKDGLHYGGYDKCGIPFDAYSYKELIDKDLADGCNKKSPKLSDGDGVGSACLALIHGGNWSIDKKYPW